MRQLYRKSISQRSKQKKLPFPDWEIIGRRVIGEEIRPNHFPPHSLAHEYQNVKTQGWPTTGGVAVEHSIVLPIDSELQPPV